MVVVVVDVDVVVDAGAVEAVVDGESGLVSADAPSDFDPEQPTATIRAAHRTIPRRPPARGMVRWETNVGCASSC